jgi:crossover junction endodeoxyribonuclease RuvC
MIVCGIDPGATPTLCILDINERREIVNVHWHDEGLGRKVQKPANSKFKTEPHLAVIRDVLIRENPDFVAIERITAMNGWGVGTMGDFMRHYGNLVGLAAGIGLEYDLVLPAAWQKWHGIRRPRKEELVQREAVARKELHRSIALDLVPSAHRELARKKDHNRADALLIGVWGHNRYLELHQND